MSEVARTEATVRGSARLTSLDALRGLLMALMALDHASQFVAQKHSSGEFWGGPFPVYADALAFLTRAVTHLCAPGFFFLMGAGMALLAASRRRLGCSRRDTIQHLFLRGALFIALEFVVVSRAWQLSPGGWGLRLYAGVLFALGCCTILGSLLLWLPPAALLGLGAALALATELLMPAPSLWYGMYPALARLLLIPGGGPQLYVHYPVLPWLGVTCLGIAFGRWLAEDPRRALQRALRLAVACLMAFLLVRYLNGFGNTRPRAGSDWIGFLNVVKYPPSITFQLLTLGVDLLLLWMFWRVGNRAGAALWPLVVLGQVPLFFYITHLFVYAGLGRWLTPRGTSIAAMYPYWLLGMLILYPLCPWYGHLKRRRPPHSVLRLL